MCVTSGRSFKSQCTVHHAFSLCHETSNVVHGDSLGPVSEDYAE